MSKPLSPPPTDEFGAVTQPRQLQRWLDINPVTQLTRTQAYITLPAFSVAVNWMGYSDIVASFNYEGPNNFSLKASTTLPLDPNFVLCIMWKDGVGNVHRYALWLDVGEVFYFNVPIYTGQKIAKNFRFEVWSTNSTPAILSTPIQLYTSVLGNVDYRYGDDFVLIDNDPVNLLFDNVNTPPPLPTTNLTYHWSIDSGVVLVPSSTTLVSWTDSINGAVFLPTGSVGLIGGTILPNSPIGFINSASFISAVGQGDTTAVVAFVLNMLSLATTGVIFDNGNGVTFSFNHTTGKFNTFVNGVSNISPAANVWYIVIMDTNSGKTTIYNALTGELVDTFIAGTSTGSDTTFVFGNLVVLTPEILVYDNDSTVTNESIRGYFVGKYFTSMSLPLVFPPTSQPQPNI